MSLCWTRTIPALRRVAIISKCSCCSIHNYVSNQKHTQLVWKRHAQTFSTDEERDSYKSRLLRLLKRDSVQIAVWFFLTMGIVFYVATIAQKHRYRYTTGGVTQTVMNVDQMEVLKNRNRQRGSLRPSNAKGMDEIMDDLYEERVANKPFDDYENIRSPRPDEPETMAVNEARKVARLNERSNKAATAFSSEDYALIEASDIELDLDAV